MNQIPEERKDSVTKTLAILGFVAIVILIVWLAVKVVALIPSAFSSLASIADSVYSTNTQKELVVSTKNNVVANGETFTVNWTKMSGNGSYSFAYACAEGLTVDILKSGEVEPVVCDTFVDLEKATSINIVAHTATERFTDVEYTITYTKDKTADVTTDAVITIVNTAIAVSGTTSTNTNGSGTKPTTNTSGGTTPTYTAGTPTVVKKYVYQIPTSDPNGTIDLQVTHLGVGRVTSTGVFTLLPQLETGESGAIRFEIKNIGTKTASNWSYEASLPSSITYTSGSQKALKPNERVIVTLGFDGITRTGIERFGVDVEATGDKNSTNDSYTWAVKVVK